MLLAGVRDIAVIISPGEVGAWQKMLTQTGLDNFVNFKLYFQERPTGIPDAFNIVGDSGDFENVMLILGDNFFHGASLTGQVEDALLHTSETRQACIFAHKVTDLHRFGVVNVSKKPYDIVEKPQSVSDERNSYAIPGLYVFPKDVFFHAKNLKPSKRGETEITDLITFYRDLDRLEVQVLHRGIAWFDTGTPEALLAASQYVASVQHAQGFLIGSPHEVAYHNEWISKEELSIWTKKMGSGDYIKHVQDIIEND